MTLKGLPITDQIVRSFAAFWFKYLQANSSKMFGEGFEMVGGIKKHPLKAVGRKVCTPRSDSKSPNFFR